MMGEPEAGEMGWLTGLLLAFPEVRSVGQPTDSAYAAVLKLALGPATLTLAVPSAAALL